MTLAVDISNYTAPLCVDKMIEWRKEGVGLVIVQALEPPPGYPAGCTRQQLEILRDADMLAHAYVFFWFDADPSHVDRALSLLEDLPVAQVWLDAEDVAAQKYDQATTEARMADALQRCDAWSEAHGLPRTGVYTGQWYWADPRYMGDTQAFCDRLLWDSDYDYVADSAHGFQPYGGWTERAIKQHIGSTSLCGIVGVDLNVLSPAYAEMLSSGVAEPEPEPEPQPEPELVTCPAVPAQYREKFSLGPDGWPGVAANLEGIIGQAMGELEQVSLTEQEDHAKLDQIREIVARYHSGKLGTIRKILTPV